MKFPKYTIEQNRACKLSIFQRMFIRYLRGKGLSFRKIGKFIGVSEMAVRYWCMTDAERKKYNRMLYIKYEVKRDKAEKRRRQCESMKRKRKLMGKELRKYQYQFRK